MAVGGKLVFIIKNESILYIPKNAGEERLSIILYYLISYRIILYCIFLFLDEINTRFSFFSLFFFFFFFFFFPFFFFFFIFFFFFL